MTDKTQVRWGYRVSETWEEDGEQRSYEHTHDVGPGDTNRRFAERKVAWLNEHCSGRAEVMKMTVTYSGWEVASGNQD
jgi:hypothetical protein